MGIIGNLKDLIFGAKPEPKFSDSDILAAKQRAENRLYASYDQSFQPRIEHQMNVFLRKEKNESASNPVRVILRGDNNLMENATAVKTARTLLKEATVLKKKRNILRLVTNCAKHTPQMVQKT